jgi:Bacterial surface proteins containing Ig-like domains
MKVKRFLTVTLMVLVALIVVACKKPAENPPARIIINLSESAVSLEIGSSKQVNASTDPAGSESSLVWSSDNERIAAVSQNGLIEATGVGTAVIKARVGEDEASLNVTVYAKVTLSESLATILKGEVYTLDAEVLPEGSEVLTWISSDPAVASVVGGAVTGVSEGAAVVTATTPLGASVSCNFIVYADEYSDFRFYEHFDNPDVDRDDLRLITHESGSLAIADSVVSLRTAADAERGGAWVQAVFAEPLRDYVVTDIRFRTNSNTFAYLAFYYNDPTCAVTDAEHIVATLGVNNGVFKYRPAGESKNIAVPGAPAVTLGRWYNIRTVHYIGESKFDFMWTACLSLEIWLFTTPESTPRTRYAASF